MLETTPELCQRLSVHENTVYQMMADGRIPAEYTCKIGRYWRFNGEAIEAHLLEKKCAPPKRDAYRCERTKAP